MKTKHARSSTLAGILAGAALAVAAFAPQTASAATQGSAANAKILNIVTVTYSDASGDNTHQAATSTSVTVALKQAPLTVATHVAFPAVDSGSTTTSYVALTANANGGDDYKVTLTDTATNLSRSSITSTIVNAPSSATGTAFTSGELVRLGATSIVSVGTAGATQVLNIPGGALNGIAAGSTVVIAGNSYTVTAATEGSPAGYSKTGDSTVLGSPTLETYGTITIAADPDGSKLAPALTASMAGTIVAERKYLKLVETAAVSSITADGTDDFMVSTDTATNANGSNVQALASADRATFYHVTVSINKSVLNVTTPGAGATGKPGDVLEYTVTVTNATLGNAGKVSIDDTVPAYTTLVSGGSYGAGGGSGVLTEKFATISVGTKTVEVTLDPTDAESGNTDVGYGGAATIAAGTPIKFYIGTGSSSTAGGTVAASSVYTIKYQVKIN